MHLQKAEEEARALQGVGMGLAALASPYPLGEGREREGPCFYFSPGWSPGAGFPLNEDKRGRYQGEFPKLRC